MDRDQISKDLQKNLKDAQARMKKVYVSYHREREFVEGDWLYLKLQPYRQMSLSMRKNLKLLPQYFGPFKVLKELVLYHTNRNYLIVLAFHSIFHVSLLKEKIGATIQSQLPLAGDEDENLIPRPKAVLDSWIQRKRR